MDYKISSYTLSSTLGGIDSLNEIEEDIEEVRIATRKDFLQKEELKTLFKANEEKHQAEFRKKYNHNNLFKKYSLQQESTITNEVAMVEYKEPLIKRILKKIKSIFHIG